MARVNPAQFLSQVRTEAAKIVWPSRRETLMTGVMVVIMASTLALFFFGIDSLFSTIVQWLLSLVSTTAAAAPPAAQSAFVIASAAKQSRRAAI